MRNKDKVIEIILLELGKRVTSRSRIYRKYKHIDTSYNKFLQDARIVVDGIVRGYLDKHKDISLEKLDSYLNGKAQIPSKYMNLVSEIRGSLEAGIEQVSFKIPLFHILERKYLPCGLYQLLEGNGLIDKSILGYLKIRYKDI